MPPNCAVDAHSSSAATSNDQIFRHEALMEQGIPANLSTYADIDEEATNAMGTQDEGHMFNLSRTKQDFETCFPNTRIHVKVTYHDGMPHRVIVQRSTPAQGTTKLVYEKDFFHADRTYSEVATCTKFMPDRSVWMKASTFDTPGTLQCVRRCS